MPDWRQRAGRPAMLGHSPAPTGMCASIGVASGASFSADALSRSEIVFLYGSSTGRTTSTAAAATTGPTTRGAGRDRTITQAAHTPGMRAPPVAALDLAGSVWGVNAGPVGGEAEGR